MLSYEGREPTEQDRAADDDPQPRPGAADAPATEDGEEVLIDNVAAEAEDDPEPAADPDPATDDEQ